MKVAHELEELRKAIAELRRIIDLELNKDPGVSLR